MKAYEFPARVATDRTIHVPDSLLALLPSGQLVRVLILVNEPKDPEEEASWSQLTTEQFAAGYSATDAVYDRD